MELLVAADSLFFKTPDGKYWCKTIYGYDFWLRYLAVFDDVVIVSRTKPTSHSEIEGYLRVDGPNVRVLELPFMRGMKQYITNYFSFYKAAKQGPARIRRIYRGRQAFMANVVYFFLHRCIFSSTIAKQQ